MTDEQAIEQLVTERDEAQEAISHAYFLITGKSPEWSNFFGYKEALEEIDDAQKVLRIAAQNAQSLRGILKVLLSKPPEQPIRVTFQD